MTDRAKKIIAQTLRDMADTIERGELVEATDYNLVIRRLTEQRDMPQGSE